MTTLKPIQCGQLVTDADVAPLKSSICDRAIQAHKVEEAVKESSRQAEESAVNAKNAAEKLKHRKASERFLIKLFGKADAKEVIDSFDEEKEMYTICGYGFCVGHYVANTQYVTCGSGSTQPARTTGYYLVTEYRSFRIFANYINTLAKLGDWLIRQKEFERLSTEVPVEIHKQNRFEWMKSSHSRFWNWFYNTITFNTNPS